MSNAEEYFKTAINLFKQTGRKDLIVMPVANLGTMYMDETEQANLVLIIKDDGKGFDAQQQYSGNGLKNMQSRAGDMKGKIELQSAEEKGTTISLVVPIT